MKVQIDLDMNELTKLNGDLNKFLEDCGAEDTADSTEILEILENNGIEIV